MVAINPYEGHVNQSMRHPYRFLAMCLNTLHDFTISLFYELPPRLFLGQPTQIVAVSQCVTYLSSSTSTFLTNSPQLFSPCGNEVPHLLLSQGLRILSAAMPLPHSIPTHNSDQLMKSASLQLTVVLHSDTVDKNNAPDICKCS